MRGRPLWSFPQTGGQGGVPELKAELWRRRDEKMVGARGPAREERGEESIRHLGSVSGWRWRGSGGGLAGWGADVRCSIKPCEDSVINPLKMSDCRWLWEYQSGGWAWGAGAAAAAAAALLVMVLGGEGNKMDARNAGDWKSGRASGVSEWD